MRRSRCTCPRPTTSVRWVSRVAREVPVWIEHGSVNRDAATQVLALLVLRLNAMGNQDGARAAVASVSGMLRVPGLSLKATTLALAIADKVGEPIDLAVAQDLVRRYRLDSSRISGVIARTAQVEGAERALQLGEDAAELTSSEALLTQLVALARSAGDDNETQRWLGREQQATQARAQLAAREEPQASPSTR